MHNDIQPLVSEESLARKHEVSEKRVRNVLIVGGGAAFLLVFSILISGAMLYSYSQHHAMQNMRPLGLIIAPDLKPLQRFPKPNLQIDDDHEQMTQLYAKQTAELNGYGWVNRSNGTVRIPIDRAINLILQRGLLQAATNSVAAESPLQLIQKIPKQQ